MHALIVDDSATMRLVLSRLLKGHGFQVQAADGGAEALALMQDGPAPDLFVFDWNMPDVTGLDLILAVRRQERFQAAKILMVTSETDMRLMEHAVHAGADEYLIKPVNPSNLSEKLEQLGLDKHPTAAP